VANFLASPADVCVKGDDGTWQGPLFRAAANAALGPASVSELFTVKNSHFTARVVDSDCTKGLAADIPVPLVSATWSVTLVAADSGSGPKLSALVDTPSGSAEYTYIRLVHTGAWTMDADLGFLDGDGNFATIGLDAPFLGVPKSGTIDAQGYGFIAPLDGNTSLVLRGTTSQNTVLQLDGLTTNAESILTLYTTGTLAAPSSMLCDDQGKATNHVVSCSTLPAPPAGP
jgi:hypothetical protein